MSASGSIQEITLKSRRFPVAADADGSRKLGGFENEVQANGDGSVRLVKTRVPLKFDGLQVEIDDGKGDQEFLQGLADSNELFELTVTLVSGNTYQGVGQITGEIVFSTQSGTATLTLEGQAKLTIQ
jgi:hypothetical protein